MESRPSAGAVQCRAVDEHTPTPPATDTPPDIPPVPVLPLGRGRTLLTYALAAVAAAALVTGVLSLVRPSIAVVTLGDETRISFGPEVLRRGAIALLVGGVAAALLAWSAPSSSLRKSGATGLVLAAVLALPQWHQWAARVVVTPDAVTGPAPSRLFPGPPTTVQFDQAAFVHLSDRNGAGSFLQFTMRNGRQIELELGPLIDEAGRLIDAHARGKGARVSWRY